MSIYPPTGTLEIKDATLKIPVIDLQYTSNTAKIEANSNVVTEFQRSKKLIKYPRVNLTQNALNNGYVASASRENGVRQAYTAFDGDDTTFWQIVNNPDRYDTSGNATSDATLFEGDNGEWIKILLPDKVKISSIRRRATNSARRPTNCKLYGSNDDTTWHLLEVITFSNTDWADGNVNTNNYYNYFVLQVLTVSGNGQNVDMKELELYGTPEYDPEADGVDVVVKSLPNVPNTDWLEVYYDAKNYTSSPVTDESPNNYVGTLNSVTLDNSAIQSFDIPDGGNISATLTSIPSADFVHSVSVWVKFEGDTLTTSYPYLYFMGATSNYSGFGLFCAGAARPNQLHVSCWTLDYPINFTFYNDTWHHVTYTYSGGGWSRNSTLNAYVDGIEYGFGTNWSTGTEGTTPTIATSNVPLRLGATSTGGVFDGKIANFRLFNRALTSDEIYQLYAYQKEYFGHGDLSMTLKAGRLGIGTSEPRAMLDVRGDIYGGCPAFFDAYRNSGNVNGNTNPIIFNVAYINKSGVYDNTTGKFTAPIAGYYKFFFHGCIDNPGIGGDTAIRWVKNGTDLTQKLYGWVNANSHQNISGSVTVYLSSSDTFWVRCSGGTISADNDNNAQSYTNGFSGFYLSN